MREKVYFKLRPVQLLTEPGLPSVRSHIHPSGTRGEFILKLQSREIFNFLFYQSLTILMEDLLNVFYLPTFFCRHI
jgi:hypothetical protein